MSQLASATCCDYEESEDTTDGVLSPLERVIDEQEQEPVKRHQSVPGHNRYLIYKMLRRAVSFEHPTRKSCKMQTGIVQEVCRNIFSHEVEMTMKGGRIFRFKEPTAIVSPSGYEIVFVYGSIKREDTSDEALFGNMNSYNGKTMSDLLRDMNPVITRFTRFSLGERIPERGRFSRRRK